MKFQDFESYSLSQYISHILAPTLAGLCLPVTAQTSTQTFRIGKTKQVKWVS